MRAFCLRYNDEKRRMTASWAHLQMSTDHSLLWFIDRGAGPNFKP